MDELNTWEVYINIIKMLEYRNVKPLEAKLDTESFLRKLNHSNFIIITGARDAAAMRTDVILEKNVIVVMIAPSSTYATKSGDFKRILQKLPITANVPCNIIFVSHDTLTKHIDKQLANYKHEYPKLYIENYDYSMFSTEKPKHTCIPPHVIPPESEVTQFCRDWYIDRANFEKIVSNDVMAVWLGLRPGMVVKIYRLSETAGKAIAYRLCIPE